MAVTYQTTALSAGSTTTNRTVTEPSGATTDDILLGVGYFEGNPSVTPPTGWSQSFNGTTVATATTLAGHVFQLKAFWIRRGVSAPSLTFNFASAFNIFNLLRFSGALNSGDPWSFATSAIRDTTAARTFPALSGTTLTANELVIFCGTGFDVAGAGTPPTGFTEDIDTGTAGFEAAHLLQAVAGGTGSVTGASYAGGTADTTASFLFGLQESAAAAAGQPYVIRGGGVPGMNRIGRPGW